MENMEASKTAYPTLLSGKRQQMIPCALLLFTCIYFNAGIICSRPSRTKILNPEPAECMHVSFLLHQLATGLASTLEMREVIKRSIRKISKISELFTD